jgi:hypothetical protein
VRRVLFHFGGIPIYSYPAMLYLGIVLGIYAQLAAALSIGLPVWPTLSTTLLLLTAALFGLFWDVTSFTLLIGLIVPRQGLRRSRASPKPSPCMWRRPSRTSTRSITSA